MHGVLLCGGQGSRFAEAKGIPPPYPKHLEKVENQTILSLAAKSMIDYMPIDALTFILNPRLTDLYISEIQYIAAQHRHIRCDYLLNTHPRPEISPLFEVPKIIKKESNVKNYDPIIVVGQGDIFLYGNKPQELKNLIQFHEINIQNNQVVAICADGGFIYTISRLSALTMDRKRFDQEYFLDQFDLHYFQVNIPVDITLIEGRIKHLRGVERR